MVGMQYNMFASFNDFLYSCNLHLIASHKTFQLQITKIIGKNGNFFDWTFYGNISLNITQSHFNLTYFAKIRKIL